MRIDRDAAAIVDDRQPVARLQRDLDPRRHAPRPPRPSHCRALRRRDGAARARRCRRYTCPGDGGPARAPRAPRSTRRRSRSVGLGAAREQVVGHGPLYERGIPQRKVGRALIHRKASGLGRCVDQYRPGAVIISCQRLDLLALAQVAAGAAQQLVDAVGGPQGEDAVFPRAEPVGVQRSCPARSPASRASVGRQVPVLAVASVVYQAPSWNCGMM